MLDKGELHETNEGQLVVTKGPNIIHNSDSLMHWLFLLVALRINSEAVIANSELKWFNVTKFNLYQLKTSLIKSVHKYQNLVF